MSDKVTVELDREVALALLEAELSDFSEACYSAGWMPETPDRVWALLEKMDDEPWAWGMCSTGPDGDAGHLQTTIDRIRALRDATGMWFCGYREACCVEEYRFMRGF